ncbi:MAG: flagellar hook-associated protein FlgK [Chloroflexota bacterium]
MSLFGGIQTALTGLEAQQVMIETTTQNTTNADNPSYSRQVADLVANPAYPAPGFSAVGPGQIGAGVSVSDLRRVTDPFTQTQLQSALAQQGADGVTQDTTSQIEGIFNELGTCSISNLTGQFWNAWQEVSNSPTDTGVRTSLVAAAQSLASAVQQSASQLTSLQKNLDQQVTVQVSTLNTLSAQVAALNKQIVAVQANGQAPNDLLDQRDSLISQMSGLAQVSVSQQPNGAARITLGGEPLVDGTTAEALTTQTGLATGMQNIVAPDGTVITPPGGSLNALETERDQDIPGRLRSLNAWAGRMIAAVNAVHEGAGPPPTNVYNLANPGTPSSIPFFTGTDATNLAVNSSIVSNPNLIAASKTANGPGDGSNALAVVALQQDPTAGGAPAGSPSMDGQYQSLAVSIGSAASTALNNANDQQVLVSHLQQRQAQISGVSLDEEAANLISYQRAYEASARALTTFDSMLSTLINNTGLVGTLSGG